MSRTKFMGIFLIILGVISVVVGIVRGDMTSSAAMFIGYLVPALLGAMIRSIIEQPDHLAVPDITVQPVIQDISPM